MDTRLCDSSDDPVVVTGFGHVIRPPYADGDAACDPLPYLKVKKLRKYMGVQDDMAVIAAAKALYSARLTEQPTEEASLGERAGLYLVVGCIPFEQSDVEPLLAGSVIGEGADRRFSLERFSTTGFRAVNGLLTFRCLPNMPAFHVSVNFDIQGPYFVTYPGPGQFYLALEEAHAALNAGTIDVALVGGVAHQRNMLVTYHFGRLDPPIAAERLVDAAGFVVLERKAGALARGGSVRGQLYDYACVYQSFDPFEEPPVPSEQFQCDVVVPGELGPASLPVMLSVQAERGHSSLAHQLASRDGLKMHSRWELS
jgi:3-oxoacyl-(acyl-carrier-protein) synthase